MKRLNWSSVVRSIARKRSGKALFFKPVCVIAALDLASENPSIPNCPDAAAILERFSDYVTPVFQDRGNDGVQPLWRLSKDGLWTFYKGDRALAYEEFPDGNPGTRKRLLERSDRMAIHEDVAHLWMSDRDRQVLRDQMLDLLRKGDDDSRGLGMSLLAAGHSLKGVVPDHEAGDDHPAIPRRLRSTAATATPSKDVRRAKRFPRPEPVEHVPTAIDYAWSEDRIVVARNSASIPRFPFASSVSEHGTRLEVCLAQAEDLLADLRGRRWQVRDDYGIWLERYVRRLPNEPGAGSVLLADAAIRTLRGMFDSDRAILPGPFAAALKILLEQHIALRPFYPEIDGFYRAVRTGRIDRPLPLDAVDRIASAIREQTPTVFDEGVSTAIVEASAPEPDLSPIGAGHASVTDVISPPPDPIGELDPNTAHDFQKAGVLNALWKVFTSADDVRSNTESWIKAYASLSGPIGSIIDWLRNTNL